MVPRENRDIRCDSGGQEAGSDGDEDPHDGKVGHEGEAGKWRRR